jgi:hypothetical protein
MSDVNEKAFEDANQAGASRARRVGSTGGLNGRSRFVGLGVSAEHARAFHRPNGAPPYYLGRPARLWITAMRLPRRRPT